MRGTRNSNKRNEGWVEGWRQRGQGCKDGKQASKQAKTYGTRGR